MFKGDPSFQDEIEAKDENVEDMTNDKEDYAIEQDEKENDEEFQDQDMTEDEKENENIAKDEGAAETTNDPRRSILKCRGSFRRCEYLFIHCRRYNQKSL